jgi:hypothetical protein
MADKTVFAATFKTLRGVLERHRGRMIVRKNGPEPPRSAVTQFLTAT